MSRTARHSDACPKKITFFFDLAYEALGICVQIVRPRRQSNDFRSLVTNQSAKLPRVLGEFNPSSQQFLIGGCDGHKEGSD